MRFSAFSIPYSTSFVKKKDGEFSHRPFLLPNGTLDVGQALIKEAPILVPTEIFKEYTGSSPVDYLNELRIDRACFEISVNRKNATEAAYATGFNDQSYFSKVFRKYRGISPTEYKKSLTERRK